MIKCCVCGRDFEEYKDIVVKMDDGSKISARMRVGSMALYIDEVMCSQPCASIAGVVGRNQHMRDSAMVMDGNTITIPMVTDSYSYAKLTGREE